MALRDDNGNIIIRPKTTTSSMGTGNIGMDRIINRISKTNPILAKNIYSTYTSRKTSPSKTSPPRKTSPPVKQTGNIQFDKMTSILSRRSPVFAGRLSSAYLSAKKRRSYLGRPSTTTNVDTSRISGILANMPSTPSIYDSGLVNKNIPSGVSASTWNKIQKGTNNLDNKNKINTTPEHKSQDRFPDIKTSPYLTGFGYMPHDKDYSKIYSDIQSKKVSNSQITNLLKSPMYTHQMLTNLDTVSKSPENSRWTIGGMEYSKEEAINLLKKGIRTNIQSSRQIPKIPRIINDQKKIRKEMERVRTYEKRGYEVELTDKGYKFSIPKASKVFSWYVGNPEEEKKILTASSFIESPLAIGTLFDITAGAITGDKSWGKRRLEKLSKFSLDLEKPLSKGDYVGFAGKVAFSPAMVEGVYLPAVTLGSSYALSGITAGASGVTGATSSIWGRVGARGGMTLVKGLKVGQGVFGGAMIGTSAIGITSGVMSGKIDKYDLPSLAGNIAFTVGMASAGYKAGSSMWTHGHTGSYQYNWKTGRAKWSPKEIPKSKNIYGMQDIVERPIGNEGVKGFTGMGEQLVEGKKVDILTQGKQYPVKGSGGKTAYAEGTAKLSRTTYTPKYKIRGIRLGTIKESTHFHRFRGVGTLLNQKGKNSLTASIAESEPLGRLGDTTTSKGLTLTADKGGLQLGTVNGEPVIPNIMVERPSALFPEETVPTSIGVPKHSTFLHMGNYEGTGVFGKNVQVGNIFSFNKNPRSGFGSALFRGGGLKDTMPSGGSRMGLGSLVKLDSGAGSQGSVMSVGGESPVVSLGAGSGMPSVEAGSKSGLSSLLKADTGQGSKMFDYGSILEGVGAKAQSVFGGGSASVVSSGSSIFGGVGMGLISVIKPFSVSKAEPTSVMKVKTSSASIVKPISQGGLSLVSTLGQGSKSGGSSSRNKFRLSSVVGNNSSKIQKSRPVVLFAKKLGFGQLFNTRNKHASILVTGLSSMHGQAEINKQTLKPIIHPFTVQATDIIQESEPVVAVTPVLGSATAQSQQQQQKSALALNLVSVAPLATAPVFSPSPVFTPFVAPTPIPPKGSDNISSGRHGMFSLFGKQKKGKRVLVKTVLADPFMVELSQVKFGKATNPIPTKNIWKIGEETWWRIPTIELMKEKKGKKSSNSKIALNVFRG